MLSPLLCTLSLIFFHSLTIYSTRPFIPLLVANAGAGNIEIGLVSSAYGFIQVLLALIAGKIVDRLGPCYPAILGSVSLVIGVFGLALAKYWYILLVFTVLVGFAHLFLLVSSQTVVTSRASGRQREHNVGLMTFVTSAASFIGPVMGGWLQDSVGIVSSYFLSAAIAVITLGFCFTLPKSVLTENETSSFGRSALLDSPLLKRTVFISGTVFFATEVITTYFPLYGKEIGLSSLAIGSVFSTRGFTQMMIRPFMGHILKIFGSVRSIMVLSYGWV